MMMNITAFLELWTIGDGSYPHLNHGMDVNFSFEMSLFDLRKSDCGSYLDAVGCAEYAFGGIVTQRYEDPEPLVVIDAGAIRFFCEGPLVHQFQKGDMILGKGALVVDYYSWAETVDQRDDPPDIFYNLSIQRIRKVAIPSQVSKLRDPPTWRSISCDGAAQVTSTLTGELKGVVFILDLTTVDRLVPHTFLT
jgi:hypothetical protein